MLAMPHPSSSSSCSNPPSYLLPLQLGSPYITYIPPTRYDEKGRQIPYTESILQRRERLAFLNRRAWARRVGQWVNQSASIEGSGSSPTLDERQFAEDDPSQEPYILYSSSQPRSGHGHTLSPPTTTAIPSLTISPTTSPSSTSPTSSPSSSECDSDSDSDIAAMNIDGSTLPDFKPSTSYGRLRGHRRQSPLTFIFEEPEN